MKESKREKETNHQLLYLRMGRTPGKASKEARKEGKTAVISQVPGNSACVPHLHRIPMPVLAGPTSKRVCQYKMLYLFIYSSLCSFNMLLPQNLAKKTAEF